MGHSVSVCTVSLRWLLNRLWGVIVWATGSSPRGTAQSVGGVTLRLRLRLRLRLITSCAAHTNDDAVPAK